MRSAKVIGLDVLGSILGDDGAASLISTLFKAAGEGTSAIVSAKQASDAKDAADTSGRAKLANVLAADIAATNAVAQGLYSADLAAHAAPGPAQLAAQGKAQADQALAAQALAMQDATAAGLSAAFTDKRVAAAQAALTKATQDWSDASAKLVSSPSNVALQAAVQQKLFLKQAAETTAMKAASAQIQATTGKPPTAEEQARAKAAMEEAARAGSENFLTKKLGPLPVYGWGLVGVGGLGLGMLAKRYFGRAA